VNESLSRFCTSQTIKIDLPDFEEAERMKSWSPEQMRQKMKERGLLPGRRWIERPISISCTGATMDPYVPPEGDGKLSAVTPGVSQK
jgi:large subunit ribosomal protein L45